MKLDLIKKGADQGLMREDTTSKKHRKKKNKKGGAKKESKLSPKRTSLPPNPLNRDNTHTQEWGKRRLYNRLGKGAGFHRLALGKKS